MLKRTLPDVHAVFNHRFHSLTVAAGGLLVSLDSCACPLSSAAAAVPLLSSVCYVRLSMRVDNQLVDAYQY